MTRQPPGNQSAGGAAARTGSTAAGDADGDRTPIDVDHAPPRLSQGIALGGVLIGAVSTTLFATLAIPFGVAGVALVAGGLFATHSRTWLSVGTALVLLGAIVTGTYGAVSPALMLVGVGATILAWDVGQHGIVIGQQLGRRPRSTRSLLVHAVSTTVVIGLINAVAYIGYVLAGGGRHAAAVAVVILGLIVVAWVFRS